MRGQHVKAGAVPAWVDAAPRLLQQPGVDQTRRAQFEQPRRLTLQGPSRHPQSGRFVVVALQDPAFVTSGRLEHPSQRFHPRGQGRPLRRAQPGHHHHRYFPRRRTGRRSISLPGLVDRAGDEGGDAHRAHRVAGLQPGGGAGELGDFPALPVQPDPTTYTQLQTTRTNLRTTRSAHAARAPAACSTDRLDSGWVRSGTHSPRHSSASTAARAVAASRSTRPSTCRPSCRAADARPVSRRLSRRPGRSTSCG